MKIRKKSKWATIVVPCPNCGCDCDVELGSNSTTTADVPDSEPATKRRRLDAPKPKLEPDLEPELNLHLEPNPNPNPDSSPGHDANPDPSSDPEPHLDSEPDPYAISDEELDPTQTPEATHVERFFAKCPSFNYNSSQHIMAEFYRLCASGKLNRGTARQRFRDALTRDFNNMYGVDENDLRAWQRLCRVLVKDIPDEIEDCQKIVRSRFINIVDLVDTHITENPVLQFRSEAELSSYTKTTGKYFPNDSKHAGSLLRFLLRFIVSPTDAKISVSSDSETEAQPITKRLRVKLEPSDSEFESKPDIPSSLPPLPPSSCPPTSDADSDDDIPPWPTTYPKPEPPSQLPKPEPLSQIFVLPPTPPTPPKPEPLTQTNIHQFFSQYASQAFEYNPSRPVMSEFYRMVDSKDFPQASQAQAKREIEDALTLDFNLIYGTDVGDLAAWQGLCRVLEFDYVPDDLLECKKMVAATYVNILDLIDTKFTGQPVRHFNSEKALSDYTRKHRKFFPRHNVHSGGLLKFLLRRIHNPTAATRDNPNPRPLVGRRQ
ncbi:hypothetical protein RSOLAG22IIIB_11991 [Rhizoctonia solani]|uniref:Uncharacterized protein n=1 Tax=Rhizoctonia solani TaxID=456999 RepID=A0A0K6GAW9_9AGAM|nr:hypothetical protein RSOLAG22IIIB_11991 [Rhizoctonia solani]